MSPANAIYLAAPGFEHHLAVELGRLGASRELLPGVWEGPPPRGEEGDPVWFRNLWIQPEILTFGSVSEAADLLRKRNGLWVDHLVGYHRRGQLIKNKLPAFRPKPLVFPQPLPKAQIGGWTLLDENTLLCSAKTLSPFPGGVARFAHGDEKPPSAAAGKLQEALTLMRHWWGVFPQPGEHCLDAGCSPGGWSWVLARLGCRVLAVDRSPLDLDPETYSQVRFFQGDGFKVHPRRLRREGWEPVDWVFSDMAAYPARVWEWVKLWLEAPEVPHMVVTLKMQGEPDWETLHSFQRLTGGRLVHLYHNKHELTWMSVHSS